MPTNLVDAIFARPGRYRPSTTEQTPARTRCTCSLSVAQGTMPQRIVRRARICCLAYPNSPVADLAAQPALEQPSKEHHGQEGQMRAPPLWIGARRWLWEACRLASAHGVSVRYGARLMARGSSGQTIAISNWQPVESCIAAMWCRPAPVREWVAPPAHAAGRPRARKPESPRRRCCRSTPAPCHYPEKDT